VGLAFVAGLTAIVEGGTLRATAAGLRVDGADAVTLLVAAGTSYGGGDPMAAVQAQLAAAARRGYSELRAAHLHDHAGLFDRVALDLGTTAAAARPTDERIRDWQTADDPQLVALLFQYGRYLLIASSRPGTQPANLQGIWNDQVRPPWSSNWTLNINAEMNYWPAEVANLAECHTPLFDLIAGLSVHGRHTAATNYGCGGWVAHHNTDIWRQAAPVGDFGHGDPTWANCMDAVPIALASGAGRFANCSTSVCFFRDMRKKSTQKTRNYSRAAAAGCSRYPPASARSSTAPIVSTNARAASTLSSTATRAPGPSASFTKSIFRACSNGASNG
jgi:hypothetical protein